MVGKNAGCTFFLTVCRMEKIGRKTPLRGVWHRKTKLHKKKPSPLRGIEWSLRAFASMRAVRLFLQARAVINFLMRAAST